MNNDETLKTQALLSSLPKPDFSSFRPLIYDLSQEGEFEKLNNFLNHNSDVVLHDKFEGQIKELYKIRNPKKKFNENELNEYYRNWAASKNTLKQGLFVYYPWKKNIVRIVSKEEFIELRTSRNKYKISPEEQQKLADETIGVVGLSVGQSVAVTICIERICGTLRIADFDELELTNLNRIRSGIDTLGLPKTIMVAREIAEIDPFINVEVYNEGITEENIDDFLTSGNGLDLLIEECDSLDIKILARLKARKHGIPVLMDTSDRGMIDIERFDLEPDRDILHGKIKVEDINDLKGLSYEEKVPFILEMVGVDKMSNRLKSSMIEIEQTLTTWPQLAGEVALGGALCTEITREILLNKRVDSGRFYFDFKDFMLSSESGSKNRRKKPARKPEPDYEALIQQVDHSAFAAELLPGELIEELAEVSILAPSAGNVQPWKIFHRSGVFYVFLDVNRIDFFGDYNRFASLLSVGGILENARVTAAHHNYDFVYKNLPLGDESLLAAVFYLNKNKPTYTAELYPYIRTRHTNRDIINNSPLPTEFVEELLQLNEEYESFDVLLADQQELVTKIAGFVALADAQRILNKKGHEGFYQEIRWSDREARLTGDGIDIETVDVTPPELAGFRIARSWDAVELLSEMKLGKAFGNLSLKAIRNSSAILHISGKEYNKKAFIEGGMLMEKTWLLASKYNIAYQPLLSTCLFNNMVNHAPAQELPELLYQAMDSIREEYKKVFKPVETNQTEIFLARLSVADKTVKKAYRRNKKSIFYNLDNVTT